MGYSLTYFGRIDLTFGDERTVLANISTDSAVWLLFLFQFWGHFGENSKQWNGHGPLKVQLVGTRKFRIILYMLSSFLFW